MIAANVAAPPPCGAPATSSLAPRAAAAVGAVADAAVGPEMILGHPTLYVSDNIPLDEAVSTAHRAPSQVQRVLRREDEGLVDDRRCLQLWATILKETTVSERATARTR
jgi:hypothetical protein